MRGSFFRTFPADVDPARLLDPDQQVSEPWGEHEHGPCDKCGGGGSVAYGCSSCLARGVDPRCPACQGRVRFVDVCPACLGDGRISHTVRRGVAVFPSRPGLYRYLGTREASPLDQSVVIELDGPLSEERDLDADAGSLLIRPTRVVGVEPLDAELVAEFGRRRGDS